MVSQGLFDLLAKMRWTRCGPRAVLFQVDGPDEASTRLRMRAIQRFLESSDGVLDFSIAFDKVLVEFPPGAAFHPGQWAERFAALPLSEAGETTLHEIPVYYDGPDLGELADRHGLSISEVVERHAAPIYEVALLGFSPGFPYLTGLDPKLHTPRRANPRPRVPTGSVAIGGAHTGIYSVESPGGWNIIGNTTVRLFDLNRREPDDMAMFLLRPGDRVKFIPVK